MRHYTRAQFADLPPVPDLPFRDDQMRVIKIYTRDFNMFIICGELSRIPTVAELGGLDPEEEIDSVSSEGTSVTTEAIFEELSKWWGARRASHYANDEAFQKIKSDYLLRCHGWAEATRLYQISNRNHDKIIVDPKSLNCAVVVLYWKGRWRWANEQH